MKKILSMILLIFLNVPYLNAVDNEYGDISERDKFILSFGESRKCKNIKDSDIPTIFIPGILASWYSEEGYEETKIKKWTPDPVTHAYDTLFKVFQDNGYTLRDVYYKDEFTTYIEKNPKKSLYLFGYDWKKDNKVTAKILSKLVLQIREKYEQDNGCDIGTVNIIGHSMGGLVARTMLEDMCVSEKSLEYYHNRERLEKGEMKDFISSPCRNYTRVNKFITIATPHRGSPSSLAIWEKGDIGQTETYVKGSVLKGQLGVLTDNGLYELIHGYNKKLSNGIVTIGQLLPNISKNGTYNNDLLYLEKGGKKISAIKYTQNPFLDELNSRKNIDKMFSNITGKFSSYYSEITGNKDKNNVIGYKISDTYFNEKGTELNDLTEVIDGKDIYSKYPFTPTIFLYNISENIRNSGGLGGDGTVPTNNLKLIANDGYDPQIENNTKFENKLIKCYDENKPYFTETDLVYKLGETNMELCAHSKMPTLTSIQVLDNILGNELFKGLDDISKLSKEIELLYKSLGYANNTFFYGSLDKYDSSYLIKYYYNYYFAESDKKINEFIENRKSDDYDRKSLNYTSGINELIRYEILSPINLLIEDEQGRKIGIDPDTGMIINEIPGAWTSGDTEGSGEPEFFLIPKTGTGTIQHKIHSYGTGDGEYHIVMNEIKLDNTSSQASPLEKKEQDQKNVSFVIAGTAKKGVVENYVSKIEESEASYEKIDTKEIEQNNTQKQSIKTGNNSSTSSANAGPVKKLNETKKVELKYKYKDILTKLYNILDTKYTQKKKQKLKQNLLKFKQSKNPKYKDNEKVNFLIEQIIEYVK
ncbi:MAG: hypothetical protein Q8K30_04465 [Candidatus Gracilibacteria bacterium]|nr:hypothetical protein [Candidatus Gracilibacteria bacterium]